MKKRILSIILAAALCLGLLPTTALAGGESGAKTVTLGTSGIRGGQADSIYFGNYWQSGTDTSSPKEPIKWKVLDAANKHEINKNGATTTSLFLLSEKVLDHHEWKSSPDNYKDRDYGKSGIRTWLTGTFQNDAFNQKEQDAIATTYVKTTKVAMDNNPTIEFEATSSEDKVFLLSKEEAMTDKYGFSTSSGSDSGRQAGFSAYADRSNGLVDDGTNAIWWLRSPGSLDGSADAYAALVDRDGHLSEYGLTVRSNTVGVRPALNLDLSKVLFTSPAGSDHEWKLTLKDTNATISGTVNGTTELTVGYSQGQTLTVNHNKLSEIGGNYNHITAALTDSNNNVRYYGSINTDITATSSQVEIPTGLGVGNYTLSVYGEQWNGDYKTDYATATPLTTTITVGLSKEQKPSATFTATGYDSGTLSGVDSNMKYQIGNGAWTDITSSGDIPLTGLSPCTISVVKKGDGTNTADSEPQEITVSKAATPTGLETKGCTNSSNNDGKIYGFSSGTTYEYKKEGAVDYQDVGGAELTGLASGTYDIRVKANGAVLASDSVPIVVPGYAEFAVSVVGSAAQNTGAGSYAQDATVSIDAGTKSGYTFAGWTSADNVVFADAKSAQTTFTMLGKNVTVTATWTANSPSGGSTTGGGFYTPTAPTKTPSQQTVNKVETAKPGDTVSMTIPSNGKVDKEIFEALSGKDVTLEITLPGGMSWTINGTDIPKGTHFSDLNLGVKLNTNGISVDVLNLVTGAKGTIQITLSHDGPFGFTLTLNAPLGKENAGYWANLYHFNEQTNSLDYETSGMIGADGSAALRMTHASQYAIVIDNKSHEPAAFADVNEGTWYYDAVQYVYQNGLMNGTGNGLFSPKGTTSRAMIMTILARLDGVDTTGGATWYEKGMTWAVQNGVSDGTNPEGAITREQLAAMLYRYAQKQGEDVSASADLSGYADASQVSDWALDALRWANAQGIINGNGNGRLNPGGNATRAETAAMLQRYLEQ